MLTKGPSREELEKELQSLRRDNYRLSDYVWAIKRNRICVADIIQGLETKDWALVIDAWNDLEEKDQKGLWRAPSKGGFWDYGEREELRRRQWSNSDST